MYATCLFCRSPLGRNETLEAFPVGRRLAYDAERGRLWVVCRGCERWNLTPLDARWEAIEGAERLYAGTHRRAATDQIGLAVLPGGLELVRIGRPLRPEFAAWRYGDQFGRRRRRQALWAALGLAGIGGLIAGGAAAGVGVGSFLWIGRTMAQRVVRGQPDARVARVAFGGVRVELTRRDLADVRIGNDPGQPFTLELRQERRHLHAGGAEAVRAAGALVPAINRYGGSARAVQDAVARIERAGGSEGYLERLRRIGATTRAAQASTESRWWGRDEIPQTGLYALHPTDRLALEMAAHEEQERRALEGELAELERAWQEAEAIASIADDLLVPEGVRRRLDALRGRGDAR